MLQDIRENAQGTIAKIIIGLLIVSLSIWGMDAIIGGFSGEPEVATVNGEEITEREFLRTVQLESQRRLSEMDRPDPSMLNDDQIRREVLDALIQEQVLVQDAERQGLALSGADVDALITQMPQFQVDGSFNRDRFVSAVRNFGMGVAEFREAMRKEYVVNQIRAGIMQSGLVAEENAAQILRIQNQTRDFRTLTLPADAVADQVEVGEADIESYYQNNAEQFQTPEQVDANYIVLSQQALADTLEISEQELRDYYDQRASELAREERRAAHILLEDGSAASDALAEIQERLAQGESFSELAREYSVDTVSGEEGGDLGFAGRGVYDSAFEEALFSLEEGEVSEPVSTSFGVHLIKLLDVRSSDVPAFAEVKDQLRNELASQKASERYAEFRSELADLAYAADDLAGPAEELGLEVREKTGISREGGEPPFDHAGLVRQLFSEDVLKDGFNTELIDVGDNLSVVARVKAHHEARTQPLAEVRDQIRERLVARRTAEALQQRAEELIAALKSGSTLAELNLADGQWQSYTDQGRRSQSLSPAVLAKAFSLARPQDDAVAYGTVLSRNGLVVVALDEVQQGAVAENSDELEQIQQFLASIEGQREYAAYEQQLRQQAEVERP